MVINWYGEGCFKIQTSGLTLMVDPFDKSTGLTPPRFKSDILIKTQTQLPLKYEKEGRENVLGPGEYELHGIEISGWPAPGDGRTINSVYLVKSEGLALGLLGHLASVPSSEVVHNLGETDILFVPAGGAPYISRKDAAGLIKQLAPKIAVASFFRIPGLKVKTGEITDFLKETGQKAEPQESLVIKKKDLPEKIRVVVLKV